MKNQIYTMPEAFYKDEQVPTRWRVLAYVNGFFINGNTVWASNQTIADELKIKSTKTITTAIKELEQLKLIRCKRTKSSRIILPFYEDKQPEIATLDSNTTPSTLVTSYYPPSNQLLPNSDNNNSDNNSLLEDKSSQEVFNFNKFLVEKFNTSQEKSDLAGMKACSFLRHKKFDFRDSGLASKRYNIVRKAFKDLDGFSLQEIRAMFTYADNQWVGMEWTEHAIVKNAPVIIPKLKEQGYNI